MLAVDPAALAAAAARLRDCASRLDTGLDDFRGEAARDLPAAGRSAEDEARRTAVTAAEACAALRADLDRLATALEHLSALYTRLDRGTLPTAEHR